MTHATYTAIRIDPPILIQAPTQFHTTTVILTGVVTTLYTHHTHPLLKAVFPDRPIRIITPQEALPMLSYRPSPHTDTSTKLIRTILTNPTLLSPPNHAPLITLPNVPLAGHLLQLALPPVLNNYTPELWPPSHAPMIYRLRLRAQAPPDHLWYIDPVNHTEPARWILLPPSDQDVTWRTIAPTATTPSRRSSRHNHPMTAPPEPPHDSNALATPAHRPYPRRPVPVPLAHRLPNLIGRIQSTAPPPRPSTVHPNKPPYDPGGSRR